MNKRTNEGSEKQEEKKKLGEREELLANIQSSKRERSIGKRCRSQGTTGRSNERQPPEMQQPNR
jgi:hypothetical protein